MGRDDGVLRDSGGRSQPRDMNAMPRLRQIVLVIAVLAVTSGLVQLFAPGFVLVLLSAESSAVARHFFGIVGMFMVLFGGLLYDALRSSTSQEAAVLWAGLQTFGALGVAVRVISRLYDGSPYPAFDFFAGYELVGVVLIASHSRRTLSGA